MKKILSLCVVCAALLLTGCQGNSPASGEVFVMDTSVSQLQVYGKRAEKAVDAVNDLLVTMEEKLSLYRENSEIAQINRMAGKSPVKVSKETYELLTRSLAFCAESEGKFDITIAPLSLLWGITSEHPQVPDADAITAALDLVDYRKVILDDNEQTVYLSKEGMAIDLGGVAKGYLSSLIEQVYSEYEVTSALVSVGGNIFAYGTKPDGSDWTLALRDPEGKNALETFGELRVSNTTVATSGAYERYFEKDGVLYHHILDPATGAPAKSDLLSVTVITPDGAHADALSTALYIGGTAAVKEQLHHGKFDVIAVDTDGIVYVSDGMANAFTLTKKEYTRYDNR